MANYGTVTLFWLERVKDRPREAALNMGQIAVLTVLCGHAGYPTVGEIARSTRMSRASVQRAITALRQAELVRQDDHPTDARRRAYRVTALGRDAHKLMENIDG